jgi:glycerophosphoryl diester phosphodiesterase
MNYLEMLLNKILNHIWRFIPVATPSSATLKAAKIVAHRGVHENNVAMENSMAAFSLAVENKIWGIELDVRMSKDNVAFVLHDPDTKRLFGKKNKIKINETPADFIIKNFPQIPQLSEVIKQFSGQLHLMIEIKEDYTSNFQALAHFQSLLNGLTPVRDFHLLTLTPDNLTPFVFVPNEAKMDVIWLNPNEIFNKNEELKHAAIAGHFLFLSSKRINMLKHKGRFVGVGFIESKNILYKELNRGVDWIFTNHPLSLRKLMPD